MCDMISDHRCHSSEPSASIMPNFCDYIVAFHTSAMYPNMSFEMEQAQPGYTVIREGLLFEMLRRELKTSEARDGLTQAWVDHQSLPYGKRASEWYNALLRRCRPDNDQDRKTRSILEEMRKREQSPTGTRLKQEETGRNNGSSKDYHNLDIHDDMREAKRPRSV